MSNNKSNGQVDAYSYEDLLKVSPTDLPSFEELLQMKNLPLISDEPASLTDEGLNVLPTAMLDIIKRNLAPIVEVCCRHHYSPLAIEVSIIADKRVLNDRREKYFNSYFEFNVRRAREIAKGYFSAMEFMNTPEAAQDMIVPHKRLYDRKNALITLNCIDFADTSSASQVPQSPPDEPYITGRQFPYSAGRSEAEIKGQVGLFVKKFLEYVAAVNPDSRLLNSKLVLHPFVRPGGADNAPSSYGEPAGAMFIFAHPEENASSIQELGKSLSWLLAAATIKESFSSLEVAIEKRDLFGSMVHGTVHAVRSIQAAALCRSISERTPPENIDDLKIRVFDADGKTENRARAQYLVEALRNAMLGEDTAAALLSFCEMKLNEGLLRRKFQNQQSVRLRQLLNDASSLVQNLRRGTQSETYANSILVNSREQGPHQQPRGGWSLPAGYLSEKIVRGLFSELLRNVAEHGARDENGRASVDCRFYVPQHDSALRCEFRNAAKEGSNERELTSGFLIRTQRILKGLGSIALEFACDEDSYYRATLTLGDIRAEGMVDGQVNDISPLWTAD